MRYHGVNNNGEDITSSYVDHSPETFAIGPGGPSLTRQEFAAECDINNLMAQYEQTGVLNHFNQGTPQYLDVTGVPDLAESIAIVDEAKMAFMRLPAHVRREFNNDPVEFVNFASDPENVPQMRTWGLAPPAPEEPKPQRVEIVNPTPTPDSSGK